jgi:hypothetical protein
VRKPQARIARLTHEQQHCDSCRREREECRAVDMSTRVAIALGAIAVLGVLIARIDRRQERPAAVPPRIDPEEPRRLPAPAAETGDDFDVLIEALEAGSCEWISTPVRRGNRLAVTTGNGATHSYTFSPTADRLTRLRQAVDRNHVLTPHGTRAE